MRLNLEGASNVGYSHQPAFVGRNKVKETAAQANGRRYEEKVGIFLRSWAPGNQYGLKDHPWIQYQNADGQVQYCQPDYLLVSNLDDNIIIVEAKLRHTRDVIGQLERYRDLIQRIHPEYKASLVEICRYFDPSECRMELLTELRPHPFPYAAMLFEPIAWTLATN